ncbi:uncharacterized protein LOC134098511 [Sardina pilchardus]|uniref:uncharacterized protein LOC134098511 n=1 Tax=Sardina pilchardus TaxID=27697 RepID=UPI002E0F81E9
MTIIEFGFFTTKSHCGRPRLTARWGRFEHQIQVRNMASALEGVNTGLTMAERLLPTHRECNIDIKNTSAFILCNPKSHSVSGYCNDPLPPTLNPSEEGKGCFIKTAHTACGSVGVFTYDIFQQHENQYIGKIAVMFSNPYDFSLYSNWYAVGVLGMEKSCDYELYNEMYNGVQMGFVRGKASGSSLTHDGSSVGITASMSDSYQPVLKIKVYNRGRQ